jgi:NAD(P)-dependent dehydrogenase (short-subunit alcohol dehydrogenase family)
VPEGPVRADLRGRVAVVTGASAGVGKAAALGLARLGARVVLAVRNSAKGESVRREIVAATGNESVELLKVDLAHQDSTRAATAELRRRHPAVAILVNNAGVWLEKRQETPDGIETTWATNVLGYHLFTHGVRSTLEAGAPARIVNVASEFAKDLDLEDVELRRRPYRGALAYAQSKQANRMWTWALARRLADPGGSGQKITTNAMHPGFVASELYKKSGGLLGKALSVYSGLRALSPEEGADTVVWLAASPEAHGLTGRFFVKRRERSCPFRGEPGEEALFSLCSRMTGTA